MANQVIFQVPALDSRAGGLAAINATALNRKSSVARAVTSFECFDPGVIFPCSPAVVASLKPAAMPDRLFTGNVTPNACGCMMD